MANTLLRGSVDEYLLRLTIGHSSEALSDMYTHISDNALASLRTAQEQQIMPFLSVSSTVDGKE
jgi:site-specific recombinase XerD